MTCYELRQAQKRAEKAARLGGKARGGAETGVGTSFAELNTAETPGTPQPSSGDEEIFVVAKWEPPPAWKLCLYTATIGLVATVIISIVPGLRKILLPGGDYIPTPYILVVIPILALFWGGLWIYQEKFITERVRTLPGIAIAILNILFCFAAVEFDVTLPNVTSGDQAQDERADMDAQELTDWRSEMLKQYQP